jgi:hypothetical protein
MQEFERQQYLTLMGIQSWMPRQLLPYAPQSLYIPLFDPERLDQQVFAKDATDDVTAPCDDKIIDRVNPVAEIINATRSLEAPQVPQPTHATDADTAVIPLDQVQSWQFSFLVWKDKLLCFESLQQPDAAKLAQAILGAVTGHYEHRLAQHQWPLFAEEPLESATIRLNVFMKTLSAKVNVVLFFGKLETQVFRPLLGSEWLAEHQRCVSLPSLAAMLEDASQKSVAWKQLKPLF